MWCPTLRKESGFELRVAVHIRFPGLVRIAPNPNLTGHHNPFRDIPSCWSPQACKACITALNYRITVITNTDLVFRSLLKISFWAGVFLKDQTDMIRNDILQNMFVPGCAPTAPQIHTNILIDHCVKFHATLVLYLNIWKYSLTLMQSILIIQRLEGNFPVKVHMRDCVY